MHTLGEWSHPSDVWQFDDAWQRIELSQCAYEAVQDWKRLGMHIESDRRLGYRLLGPDDPPRYLRLRRDDEALAEAPGQLTIEGEALE